MATDRKSTRRQFLEGRAALNALEQLADDDTAAHDEIASTCGKKSDRRAGDETYLLKVERSAMACQFAVFLNAAKHAHSAEAAVAALDLVEELEDQMSVYRDHSEICRINRSATAKPVLVERHLFRLLEHAVQLWRETEGAFDMTAGPLSKVWGFYRRQGELPGQARLQQARASVGSQWITLCARESTVHFGRSGIELNLGGIGKGYALDRCTETLRAAGVEDFLLHGGQSSILAHGSRARGDTSRSGWTVGVRHPLRPDRRIAEIRLQDRAIGTSGTGGQFFYHLGKRYGHVLDPRTGQPAEGVLSATTVAPQAATADALATAFFVMGPERTERYCQQHPEIAALLVCPGEKSGSVDVRAINLENEQWTCFEPTRT